MTKNLREVVENELFQVLEMKTSRPYVFRTRLERTLQRASHLAVKTSRTEIDSTCKKIGDKLNYISDQSNQTSDGTLKSFLVLEKDIEKLLKQVQNL